MSPLYVIYLSLLLLQNFPQIPTQQTTPTPFIDSKHHFLTTAINPLVLAGLYLWKEYEPLQQVVSLGNIECADATEETGFGNGPRTTPICVLFEVTLFFKNNTCSSYLVFSNIHHLLNEIGPFQIKSYSSIPRL